MCECWCGWRGCVRAHPESFSIVCRQPVCSSATACDSVAETCRVRGVIRLEDGPACSFSSAAPVVAVAIVRAAKRGTAGAARGAQRTAARRRCGAAIGAAATTRKPLASTRPAMVV